MREHPVQLLQNAVDPPADEESLLAQCPRCGYRLQGLPVHNRCPECGVMVDRRWRVFGSRVLSEKKLKYLRPLRVLVMVLVVFLLIGPAVFLGMAWARPSLPPSSDLVALWPLLPAGFFIAYLLRKPRKFLAIGPDGIHLYHGRDQMEHFEWRRVGRALDEPGGKSITLTIDGAPRKLSGRSLFGIDIFEANSAARAINSYPRPDEGAVISAAESVAQQGPRRA